MEMEIKIKMDRMEMGIMKMDGMGDVVEDMCRRVNGDEDNMDRSGDGDEIGDGDENENEWKRI